jgi:hypothetical protein
MGKKEGTMIEQKKVKLDYTHFIDKPHSSYKYQFLQQELLFSKIVLPEVVQVCSSYSA